MDHDSIIHISDCAAKTVSEFGKRHIGIQTGISKLDQYLGGLEKGNFNIVAARPGLGKTSFASTISVTASRKHKVLFMSLEMSFDRITERMLATLARVNCRSMVANTLDAADKRLVEHARSSLDSCKLYIDDSPLLTPEILKRKLEALGDVDLVVIDYLQLMVANRTEGRQQEVSDLSRELKLIAKSFNVSVLALSQLNRQCEYRDDSMPRASDLRESGSLEQDSDVILLLHRPAYFDIQSSHTSDSDDGDAKIIIAKNRFGPCEVVDCVFMSEFCGFYDIDEVDDF